jgi:hypothetical protein
MLEFMLDVDLGLLAQSMAGPIASVSLVCHSLVIRGGCVHACLASHCSANILASIQAEAKQREVKEQVRTETVCSVSVDYQTINCRASFNVFAPICVCRHSSLLMVSCLPLGLLGHTCAIICKTRTKS